MTRWLTSARHGKQSLRIVPTTAHPTSTSNTTAQTKTANTSSASAPSAPGLHDTLRASLSAPHDAATDSSTHPLESRLSSWHATQETLQHTLLRRTYGIAEPLRRGMELKLVREADGFRPAVLGAPSRVHEDILMGRDATIDVEDVFAGQDGVRLAEGGEGRHGVTGWHEEMEKKLRI